MLVMPSHQDKTWIRLWKENSIEIHCIDAWNIEMGDDTDYKHYGSNVDMSAVESRFRQNTKLAIEKVSKKVDFFIHKGFSDDQLIKLLSKTEIFTDLIFKDGWPSVTILSINR